MMVTPTVIEVMSYKIEIRRKTVTLRSTIPAIIPPFFVTFFLQESRHWFRFECAGLVGNDAALERALTVHRKSLV